MKRCSAKLVIREIQVKTTVQYHFAFTRKAIIIRTTMTETNQYWQGCGTTGTLVYCRWNWKTVQLLWKTVWWILKKLSIALPNDPSVLLLGVTPRGTESRWSTKCLYWWYLFTDRPSTDEWIKRECGVPRWWNVIHHKKEWNNFFNGLGERSGVPMHTAKWMSLCWVKEASCGYCGIPFTWVPAVDKVMRLRADW